LEYLGVDESIILEWILWNRIETCELDPYDWRYGQMAGSCENCNEPLGSMKGGRFLY